MSTIIYQDSPEYEQARVGRVFNHRRPERYPKGVVEATSVEQIVEAVKLANELGCRVSVRSGGHSWAAWSVRDNAILIDLGKYKLMELYDSNNMVKVSPSTTGQTLNTYLATVGKWFGGGHVPTVGLGGFLLQGGMGWNCANWGWACEKVKAVDVVTSDGRELHCTETENSELLWAARGAGPGFPAIVTAFHLELRDVYKVMRAATFQWPMSEYERIMEWTLKACRECDETIEAVAVALFVEGRTEPVIMSHFLTFQQTEEAAKAALHHISSTRPDGAIMEKPFEPTGLFEEYAAQLVANPEKHRYFCDNAYINNDSNVVEVLRDSFETLPRNTKSFSLYYHMGRTSERQLPDMALSMETDHYFASYTITESDEDDARCRSWLSNIMGSMERESAGAYLGDSDFQARRTKFWGDAQGKKLMDIRRKWDPKGVVCGYLDVEDKSGPAGLENVHEWQSKL
ncbi:hypothetical protein B0O99DRAFT_703236 [Bisporella sp. PMI_857]|nr:hypothetical protein B0O99DRAFT_703236 [Bisporella sp. PMI_857]